MCNLPGMHLGGGEIHPLTLKRSVFEQAIWPKKVSNYLKCPASGLIYPALVIDAPLNTDYPTFAIFLKRRRQFFAQLYTFFLL